MLVRHFIVPFDYTADNLGAGNASQVSDGAAAVILARRSVAKKLGLPILGKFVGANVVGVPPRVMGIGPAFAIPKLLQRLGVSKDEVDFYEINEAFSVVALANMKILGLDADKVNVLGGSVAIGHPLGASGARILTTLTTVLSEKILMFFESDEMSLIAGWQLRVGMHSCS